MPATAVETDVIKDAVQIACRAPSLHNSQPWQWVFNRGQLRLFLDASRVMDTDHSAREALISCGAALDHLRVAMAAAGWQSHIDRFPEPKSANHLASIDFSPSDFVTERDRGLAGAVEARRTDRLPFSAVTEWQSIEAVVASSVNRQAVHLEVIADDLHPRLEEAAQIAESQRMYDTPYHDELHWWTAPFEQSEGIPYSALVSAAESDRVSVGRLFPVARRPERRLEIPEDHAKVLLLSTDDDTRADALAAGEALSATLLECTMAGLASCPVTHLTELSVTRELIRSLIHAWSNKELVELPGVDWPEVKAEEERLMSEALTGWQERYPDVTVSKLLVCDKPARALVEASQSAQLVVVGSHGRNAMTRTFLGSVSNAVVQSARVPVIVARPA